MPNTNGLSPMFDYEEEPWTPENVDDILLPAASAAQLAAFKQPPAERNPTECQAPYTPEFPNQTVNECLAFSNGTGGNAVNIYCAASTEGIRAAQEQYLMAAGGVYGQYLDRVQAAMQDHLEKVVRAYRFSGSAMQVDDIKAGEPKATRKEGVQVMGPFV